MGTHSLAVVVGAVDDALLLLFLQDTRHYGLSNDADASVIHHYRAECVQPLLVNISVCLKQKHQYPFQPPLEKEKKHFLTKLK